MTNEREELIALNLATELHHQVDEEGEHYTSLAVHTNEEAADAVLVWLVGHDNQTRATTLEEAHGIISKRTGTYEAGIDLMERIAEIEAGA